MRPSLRQASREIAAMFGKCLRLALVGLFGAPHCGGGDLRAGDPIPPCKLRPEERKRLYISGKACPCRER
ncbi:MAG: hypothetical protein ACE5H8_08175 [Alphaproteobacteria bacterium]